MNEHPVKVKTWSEPPLFLGDITRIRCDIVVDRALDVITYSVRAVDEASMDLISSWVLPLRSSAGVLPDFGKVVNELRDALLAHIEPF